MSCGLLHSGCAVIASLEVERFLAQGDRVGILKKAPECPASQGEEVHGCHCEGGIAVDLVDLSCLGFQAP